MLQNISWDNAMQFSINQSTLLVFLHVSYNTVLFYKQYLEIKSTMVLTSSIHPKCVHTTTHIKMNGCVG